VAAIGYVTPLPFTDRDFQRYGVSYMLGHGVDVRIVDTTPLVIPGVETSSDIYRQWPGLGFRIVERTSELADAIGGLRDCDLIINLVPAIGHGASRWNWRVLREISRLGTPTLLNFTNCVPGQYGRRPTETSLAFRLKSLPKRLRRADLVNSVIARTSPRRLGIGHADFVVYGGEKSVLPDPLVGPETIAIDAHHPDFDLYLDVSSRLPPTRNQSVFLDQGYATHREFRISEQWGSFDGDAYHAHLRRLFDRVEDEMSLPVVVAAHPHLDCSYAPEDFGGRPIIGGRTADLIAESQLVIAHTTAAIGMAVMFRKPILLIFSREHMMLYPENRVYHESIAEILRKQPAFLEDLDSLDLNDLLCDSPDVRADYIADYIKKPSSPALPFWDIVTTALARHGIDLGCQQPPAASGTERKAAGG